MATYKPTSWGRTRRPKHMSEDAPTSKQTAITVTTVAQSDLANDLDGTNPGENGYITENQRFLHIQIENNDANENITLFAYNYAFGKWATLYIPVGVKNGADTTAELSYVAATFSSINGRKLLIVPIRGIDRIAFCDDGTHDANLKVRAACSTF